MVQWRHNSITLLTCFLHLMGLAGAQTCDTGFWGLRCEKTCGISCRCANGCKRQTGECYDCYVGYWGPYCTNECPSFCNKQCPSYFYNDYPWCTINRYCAPYCYRTNGRCSSCLAGYWGNYCNITCGQDDRKCKTCSKSNGQCTTCEQGFWGLNCTTNCSQNCLECSKSTGACTLCGSGFYGQECKSQCNVSHCRQCGINGCNVCDSGYWGLNCSRCDGAHCDVCQNNGSLCERCKDGYWGKNCEFKCEGGCLDSRCDKNTARCAKCKTDFWGESCNGTCKLKNCLSVDRCTKSGGPVCYQWASISVAAVFGISIGACILVLLIFPIAAGLLIKLYYSRIEAVIRKKLFSHKTDTQDNTGKKMTTVKSPDTPKSCQDEYESEDYEIPDAILEDAGPTYENIGRVKDRYQTFM